MGDSIRCYQYVTAPYARVRDVLKADALGLFQRATTSATARTENVVAGLRVHVGTLEVGTDATILVHAVVEEPSLHGPRTRLSIEWKAAKAAALFPVMKAELSVYALSHEETQVDFIGVYEPPGGVLGAAVDAIVGRRIAEAMVHHFVDDVSSRLRTELAKT